MKIIPVEKEMETRMIVLRGDICRHFMLEKKCERENCKFIHDPSICFHHWKFEKCKYNDECKKKHVNYTSKYDKNKKKKQIQNQKDQQQKQEQEVVKDQDQQQKQENEFVQDQDQQQQEQEVVKQQEIPQIQDLDPAIQKQVEQQTNRLKTILSETNTKNKRSRVKNTESFEPMNKPVDVRIVTDLGNKNNKLSIKLTDRDIVLVPNLFNDYAHYELYNKLKHEISTCGISQDNLFKLWHGDTHLIADDKLRVKYGGNSLSWKDNVPTFNMIIERIAKFFNMKVMATRYNYYKDSTQWKPFHKDAAAVKPDKADKQNFTVGISFGMTRVAAFERDTRDRTVISIPIPDGQIYAFSNQTNVLWRHGILQEPPCHPGQDSGRISVIAWGWCDGIKSL